MELLTRIVERRARVAVIGLGHVGLRLAVHAAAAGFTVTGFDVDEGVVGAVASGRSPLADFPYDEIAGQVESGRLLATPDPASLADAEVIVICVPTPLEDDRPDMSHVEAAARDVARALSPGRLVVLESTTYPGTTDEFLLRILESSGLEEGTDFFLGFSPERIDPGNPSFGISNVPKIVGGRDDRAAELMEAFYGCFVEKVVRVSSPKVAEMAKLLENTYRHVNIALANEIALLCRDLGIDVWEVIDAAATKPFGFQPFYPGPGWGGHCIPVDPAYLSWRVRRMGETARFVELAREINKGMPAYVAQRVGESLNEQSKSLKGSSVLVLGVAYKANVADTRESPAVEIIERLGRAGAEVSFHDPHVEALGLKNGPLTRTELTDEALEAADLVLVVTDHLAYDWRRIARRARLVLDTRNALRGIEGPIVRL